MAEYRGTLMVPGVMRQTLVCRLQARKELKNGSDNNNPDSINDSDAEGR